MSTPPPPPLLHILLYFSLRERNGRRQPPAGRSPCKSCQIPGATAYVKHLLREACNMGLSSVAGRAPTTLKSNFGASCIRNASRARRTATKPPKNWVNKNRRKYCKLRALKDRPLCCLMLMCSICLTPSLKLQTLWQPRCDSSRTSRCSLCDSHKGCFCTYACACVHVCHRKEHNLHEHNPP